MPRISPPKAKPLRLQDKVPAISAPHPAPQADAFLVVGIGASAGGLEACRSLIETLPGGADMAFILIQHLDPTHESMMVDLLAGRTSLKVSQAVDGARLTPGHFYVIAPGTYLGVADGALRVSAPDARHGARLPFDHLLRSLADELGERGLGIVLSGTGSDGSVGLKALKQRGGYVIAQDPQEAAYDGMPRSAIATGLVDLVVPIAGMAAALAARATLRGTPILRPALKPSEDVAECMAAVVALLKTSSRIDFSSYKAGTLQRRIEQRMAMASIRRDDMQRYVNRMRDDLPEREALAKDLLIHVTSFFRDAHVFDELAKAIIPGLVRDQPLDRTLRIWVAGCSTGEEAYSLAMLFCEAISASKRKVQLQVFASDVEAEAVAEAREGLYPARAVAEIPLARRNRFFLKEGADYRVRSDLRACVVFTEQDVLGDPPFSRLDMISCRNLLIYLRPEAQAKVISLFHFALREGGVLLLGSSETAGKSQSKFEPIANGKQVFRRLGSGRSEGFTAPLRSSAGAPPIRARDASPLTRSAALAELCKRLVLDAFAPAAALIDDKGQCLYFLGSTDVFLKVAAGHSAHDLIGMARDDVRPKLRAAIARARKQGEKVVVTDCRIERDGVALSYSIAVQPVRDQGEDLSLVCFFDQRRREAAPARRGGKESGERTAALEEELSQTCTELAAISRSLELSGEEQRATNEEAASAKEEYQATNEEMLASKEELQSLNEELNALNGQLQETLERQRTTSNDIRNILYSTDVATIFLDTNLNIRFFTPATRVLFSVIASDVGRPLADLSSLVSDNLLLLDARHVLQTRAPIEREIGGKSGLWYMRRVLPYRTQDDGVEGVVITFLDISERRGVAEALLAAKAEAQVATIAKSRFLAAASHDLRQPLQTLALLQALLVDAVDSDKAHALIKRLDETLGSVTAMLDTLLDINKIDAGTVRAEISVFPINPMLVRLHEEFAVHARARGLSFVKARCGAFVKSDPVRLEQMIRNLLSNAMKYTREGGVLLGCRRRGDRLVIEVWDTGIGIPEDELKAIFNEYHQVGNAARERGQGLGLGLSIVQRLGELLEHKVAVRSRVGAGSVFSVEAPLAPATRSASISRSATDADADAFEAEHRSGSILLIEDDAELRVLLEELLEAAGHRPITVTDGMEALAVVHRGAAEPDVIITDYNLPNGMTGIEAANRVIKRLHCDIPVIVLTGDISATAMLDIERNKAFQMNKPVRAKVLIEKLHTLLRDAPRTPSPEPTTPVAPIAHDVLAEVARATITIIDDDAKLRGTLREVLEAAGCRVEDFPSCEAFLAGYRPGQVGCLLLDAYLPGMTGLQLLRRLIELGQAPPTIMITGNSDVSVAVEAMKMGASDFIEKPVGRDDLLAAIERAFTLGKNSKQQAAWKADARALVAKLTSRQREVMDKVLAGHPSKNIAADLHISQRTVENHRAEIMKRTGSKSIAALARMAVAAAGKVGE